MSDSREYVSRKLENGKVHISGEVLSAIVSVAISEVEGVYGLNNSISAKRGVRGIRVVIAEDSTISVDCYVIALYGHSVVEVAESVQAAVVAALEDTTACSVTSVNVSISGISHPKASKK